MPIDRGAAARRVAAVVVAALLVTAAVGLGVDQGAEEIAPVQEAEAIVPAIVGGAIVGGAIVGAVQQYLGGSYSEQQVDEIIEGETEQHKIDMAIGALSQGEASNQYLTTSENYRTDSTNIASMKAKATLAEEINNGTTDVSALSSEVNETIDDYYALQQINRKHRHNTTLAQFEAINDSTAGDENLTVNDVIRSDYVDSSAEADEILDMSFGTTEVHLANGSTVQARTIHMRHTHPTSGEAWENGTVTGGFGDNEAQVWVLPTDPSDDSLKSVEEQRVYDSRDWGSLWTGYNSSAEQMKANYGPSFVEAVVAQYQAGDLDTSELVAPEILANEWGTGYNQTGDSTYQWASFAAMGVEMPDLNETAAMQVEYVAPRETRQVTLNVTNDDGNLSDSPPYNVTLERDDGTQVQKQIVDSNGAAQNPTFDLPLSDGPTVTNATFLFTSPNNGQIVDWTDGGISVDYEGVSVESEGSFNESVTDWGMLFASESPSGGWNVSEEYDPDGLGSVYFAPEEGRMNPVRDNFTIHQIQNDTGANLTTVDVRSYNRQTATAGNLTEELQQLTDLRQEVETRSEPAGGGIGFPELGGVGGVGLLLLLGAALLFLRD